MPKMYNELARWWPLISPPEDYADEAAFFGQVLLGTGLPPEPSLLELGSGGGSNAVYLKRAFPRMTLTDLSPEMLEVSRGLNPECEHIPGDMRTLRLGRTFDAVFLHDAVAYMLTADDLRRAMETAFLHCRPGGVALFVPDDLRDTFEPGTNHGGCDGEDRAIRYLEWTYDPNPDDTTCTTEYVYLLREADGSVRSEHDRHLHGLFPRAEWLRLLDEVGFVAEIIRDEQYNRELFLARKNSE